MNSATPQRRFFGLFRWVGGKTRFHASEPRLTSLRGAEEEVELSASTEREARVAMYAEIERRKLPSSLWARLVEFREVA